jgi:hypothetical protein
MLRPNIIFLGISFLFHYVLLTILFIEIPPLPPAVNPFVSVSLLPPVPPESPLVSAEQNTLSPKKVKPEIKPTPQQSTSEITALEPTPHTAVEPHPEPSTVPRALLAENVFPRFYDVTFYWDAETKTLRLERFVPQGKPLPYVDSLAHKHVVKTLQRLPQAQQAAWVYRVVPEKSGEDFFFFEVVLEFQGE